VAILPLPGGEFYHYGTSRELISSTLSVQNIVIDQREIMHRKVKPHPAMFVQNAKLEFPLTADNSEVWIENSFVGKNWRLHHKTIVTGVPINDWILDVPAGVCLDVVPMGETAYVARPYGFEDAFKGALEHAETTYLGKPVMEWISDRDLSLDMFERTDDLQAVRIFPVTDSVEELGLMMRWMISEPYLQAGKECWMRCRKMSADEISSFSNLRRLVKQREEFCKETWGALARNYEYSVFYQLNLEDAAQNFAKHDLTLPLPLPDTAPLMTRVSDNMFRSRVLQLTGGASQIYEDQAFSLMRGGLTEAALSRKQQPHLSVYADQIVWGRSPVRIDLAGGWTDTPPYCLNEGGNVVNMAIELNGQPPLQVYVKPCKEYKIVLRSIDLGAMEVVSTYEELAHFAMVGSPFSIPKAALVLAGFQPGYSLESYVSLEEQLKSFGAGIEVTLLSAIPAG
jgi:hypothetical protein